MKRYLIFAGDLYSPSGGWDDFIGDSDLIEEARAKLRESGPYDWSQIIDSQTKQEVK